MPKQDTSVLKATNITIGKSFQFGKWVFNNRVVYQKTEAIIHTPQLISYQSLYYETAILKTTLYMQLGIDLRYNSSYYADAYMPAIGQFFLQNTIKTGNYPAADVFVNLKIKSARIFFKFENINRSLLANDYYLVPHYPIPGMSFKFGVSWRFFD